MLRKVSNHTQQSGCFIMSKILGFISLIHYLYYYFIARQYLFQVDNIYYCTKQKDYILNLRFRNKGYILSIYIKDVFADKSLFQFITPIDSYLIGIAYGMCQYHIIFNNWDMLLELYKMDNTPQINEPLILISETKNNGASQEIILKLKNCGTIFKTSWNDIAKKPYLIQSLSATDAAALGVISFGCFVDETYFNLNI
jgi:hypothetical protein